MPTPHDFTTYYKTISNTELLGILENSNDYQPEAIEAARRELINRELTDAELTEAKKPLLETKAHKEKQQEKIKAIEDKVRTAGAGFIETLNPIQSGIQSSEKIIRFIVLVFGLLFLYQFIRDRYLILSSIKELSRFPIESLLYLFPLLLMAIAVIFFWKRKPIGWILLAIFLSFSFVAAAWLFIHAILWEPTGNSFIDTFTKPPPVFAQVIQLIFFSGIIYAISKKNIRELFSITEGTMLATIIISGVLTFFIIYGSS
jgi:hypothetical protein